MHIKIRKTVLILIAVVFCFGIAIISATDVSEADVSVFLTERTNHTPVGTSVNEELHRNGSEFETYNSETTCSYSRPCQNGGTCSTWSGKCYCPYGIEGDLCETIVACRSKCENRLEVNCRYDEYERIVYCDCKNSSLFYDEEADICKPCSCEKGYCAYEIAYPERRLACRCPNGYKEFNGYCKECDCGYSSYDRCQFDSNGEKICHCLDGYYLREGRCQPCECSEYTNPLTKCEVTGNVKRCFCPEGHEEVDGRCKLIEINSCETNNTCHPSAKCINRYDSIECECPEGYKGFFGKYVEPGEMCEDIDECLDLSNACWYSYRMTCVNLPGSYRCECMHGYRPDSYQQETQKVYCIQTSVSVVPSIIVVFIAFGLILVSCFMHRQVKKRATS